MRYPHPPRLRYLPCLSLSTSPFKPSCDCRGRQCCSSSCLQGLSVLASPPKGKPIMEQLPQDPWGNDYIYLIPGQKNASKFDIRSKGNDGIEGNEDDVGNWQD